MSTPALRLTDVRKSFGSTAVIMGVSLDVAAGSRHAIIGPNGAGKTTLFNLISGRFPVTSGTIALHGRSIDGLPPHEINRRGLSRSFQVTSIFPRMTVFENLQMGAVTAAPTHFQHDLERVFAMFPRLAERRQQLGGTLSGGEQQMLAIARALMSRPRLLLLDEPSLGLAPLIVRQIFEAIGRIAREEGVTIFLVEQNAFHALRLADRGYVLVNGRVRLSGTGRELLANQEVRAAYLEGSHG